MFGMMNKSFELRHLWKGLSMFIDFPRLSVPPAHARSQNFISQPPLQLSAALGLKLRGTAWSIRLCPGDGPGSGPVRGARTAFASRGRQCSSLKHLNLPFSAVSCCNPHPLRSRCQARLQGARMLWGKCLGEGKRSKVHQRFGRAVRARCEPDPWAKTRKASAGCPAA